MKEMSLKVNSSKCNVLTSITCIGHTMDKSADDKIKAITCGINNTGHFWFNKLLLMFYSGFTRILKYNVNPHKSPGTI